MNENREIFIREYLKDFNGTRAYKEAYGTDDKTSASNAWRLLRNADIQKAIQEQSNKRLKDVEIDINYIIGNIKEVTERCMQKKAVMYFDKIDKEWKQEEAWVEHEDGEGEYEGVWTFDAANSLKGLELLGKYKSIFKENVDLNVKTSKKLKDVFEQIGGEGLDE